MLDTQRGGKCSLELLRERAEREYARPEYFPEISFDLWDVNSRDCNPRWRKLHGMISIRSSGTASTRYKWHPLGKCFSSLEKKRIDRRPTITPRKTLQRVTGVTAPTPIL